MRLLFLVNRSASYYNEGEGNDDDDVAGMNGDDDRNFVGRTMTFRVEESRQ